MPVRFTAKRSHGGRRMHASVGHPHLGWDTVRDMGWWHAHTARDLVALSVRPPGQIWAASAPHFSPVAPLGASHGALTHDCLVHARGLVGPAPLRIVDAPNLPTALTVMTRPLCLPWESFGSSLPPKKGPCDLSWGGNSRRWRLVSWSRPLTWWGMPSRGAARRSCRTRAGGHSGMGSRMRAG